MENSDFKYYIKGYKTAIENAGDLIESAKILGVNNKYAQANALLLFAAEEISKSFIIYTQIIPTLEEEKENPYEKVFKDHKIKVNNIRFMVSVGRILTESMTIRLNEVFNKSDDESFSEAKQRGDEKYFQYLQAVNNGEHPSIDEEYKWWNNATELRENSLYISPSGKNNWRSPRSIKQTTYNKTLKYVEKLYAEISHMNTIDMDSEPYQDFTSEFIKKLQEINTSK